MVAGQVLEAELFSRSFVAILFLFGCSVIQLKHCFCFEDALCERPECSASIVVGLLKEKESNVNLGPSKVFKGFLRSLQKFEKIQKAKFKLNSFDLFESP